MEFSLRRNAIALPRLPAALETVLRAPLAVKLVGANAAIAAATITVAIALHLTSVNDGRMVVLLLVALIVAQGLNAVLVLAALRPLRAIEEVASRVGTGERSARVVESPLADRQMARLGNALNTLLDSLMRERERIRRLAADVIRTQDEERARVARELHDSIAQTMAGISLQLGALEQACTDARVTTHLRELHTAAAAALEEVRSLSHAMHPRVLEELGLRPALEALVRRACASSEVDVRLIVRGVDRIPSLTASALYRVAQEALSNALRHAAADSIEIRLDVDEHTATLVIEDDGQGFDVMRTCIGRVPKGLFAMRERLALIDCDLEVESTPGQGCSIRARVPLQQAALI